MSQRAFYLFVCLVLGACSENNSRRAYESGPSQEKSEQGKLSDEAAEQQPQLATEETHDRDSLIAENMDSGFEDSCSGSLQERGIKQEGKHEDYDSANYIFSLDEGRESLGFEQGLEEFNTDLDYVYTGVASYKLPAEGFMAQIYPEQEDPPLDEFVSFWVYLDEDSSRGMSLEFFNYDYYCASWSDGYDEGGGGQLIQKTIALDPGTWIKVELDLGRDPLGVRIAPFIKVTSSDGKPIDLYLDEFEF